MELVQDSSAVQSSGDESEYVVWKKKSEQFMNFSLLLQVKSCYISLDKPEVCCYVNLDDIVLTCMLYWFSFLNCHRL